MTLEDEIKLLEENEYLEICRNTTFISFRPKTMPESFYGISVHLIHDETSESYLGSKAHLSFYYKVDFNKDIVTRAWIENNIITGPYFGEPSDPNIPYFATIMHGYDLQSLLYIIDNVKRVYFEQKDKNVN